MNKDDLSVYYIAQLESVVGKLTDSEVSFENKVRRWYSQNFATPLHDTFKLSWPFILQHYYEHKIEEADHNAIFELAVKNYLPDFIDRYEQENEEFAESLLKEQKDTLEKKRKKDAEKKVEKSEPKQETPKIKEYNMTFNEEDEVDL